MLNVEFLRQRKLKLLSAMLVKNRLSVQHADIISFSQCPSNNKDFTQHLFFFLHLKPSGQMFLCPIHNGNYFTALYKVIKSWI